MKRSAVIFVLIFTVIFAAILPGCGANPSGNSSTAGQSGSPQTPEPSGDSQSGNAGVGASESEGADSGHGIPDTDESAVTEWGTAGSSDLSKDNSSGNSGTSFSEVIADRDDLYFAIKEVHADSVLGYEWKVYIENRTDKNLMFSFEKVSVNGVMCDPYWAEVVTAGKKGNCEITWMRDALEERLIRDVTEVDFTLNVYNDDDYTEAPLMHDPFTVYPLGEERAAQSGATPVPSDPEQILVDDENCTVMVTGYDPDNSWGYAVKLCLVNKTDEDLVFSAENTSVNGIMCDPFWAEIVAGGKSAISTILWDRSSLDSNEITEVKEISLPMRVYSDQNIEEPLVDETFELTPSAKQ